jgi:hypothetical protein
LYQTTEAFYRNRSGYWNFPSPVFHSITDLAMLKPETAAKLQGIYIELAAITPAD